MKIETKFDIGDIVYLLNYNDITTGKVIEIWLKADCIMYKIDTLFESTNWYDSIQAINGEVDRAENRLGRTKQELLQSL